MGLRPNHIDRQSLVRQAPDHALLLPFGLGVCVHEMGSLGSVELRGRRARRGRALREGEVDLTAVPGGVGLAKDTAGAPVNEALQGMALEGREEVPRSLDVDRPKAIEGGAVIVKRRHVEDPVDAVGQGAL